MGEVNIKGANINATFTIVFGGDDKTYVKNIKFEELQGTLAWLILHIGVNEFVVYREFTKDLDL